MKSRGNKRKCKKMVELICSGPDDFPGEFPEEHQPNRGYWSSKLPVNQGFIDSKHTPRSVRKLCIKTLIERAKYLSSIKPDADRSIRVVAAIHLPLLWDSGITVFFGDQYFGEYFDRNHEDQTWTPITGNRSLSREWGINIPDGFIERGYFEKIRDEYYSHDGEVWFIGGLE